MGLKIISLSLDLELLEFVLRDLDSILASDVHGFGEY